MRRFFVPFLLIVFFCMPRMLLAQQATPDISIDSIPINPIPGETVVLTATSYGADLSQATLSWNYNGRVIASGIGKTNVSVIAPAAGVPSTVTVTVNGLGLASGTAAITLRPASIDILWEAADAYTPPFYKGKALLPVGGLVRVTAIPTASAPKNLSFDWSRNGSALQGVSGYGKSSFVFQQNILNKGERIDASVHSGSFSGATTLALSPSPVDVIAYENKEGFVDYSKGSVSTIALDAPGVVLHFEPYYFSIAQGITSDLQFNLQIDGQNVSATKPNEVGISRPSTGGQSVLKLAITTAAYSLQHIEKAFTVLF